MKLYTLTNHYAEVIKDNKLIKVPVEYIGKRQVITVNNAAYYIDQL
ncbi:hypothetical protein V7128_02095 [Neobacillus vireti]